MRVSSTTDHSSTEFLETEPVLYPRFGSPRVLRAVVCVYLVPGRARAGTSIFNDHTLLLTVTIESPIPWETVSDWDAAAPKHYGIVNSSVRGNVVKGRGLT